MHLPPLLPPRSSHGPKCSQRVDFTLCQLSAKTVEPCLSGCAPSCAMATCVCLCVCACARVHAFLTLGQKQHYWRRVGGRVHVKLEHSFSAALSYAQVPSSPGHMICSRAREEDDDGSQSDNCVAVVVDALQVLLYCKWGSHSLYCWFSRWARRGLGEGVDGRLAGRVLTNLRGCFIITISSFFTPVTSQAGLIVPESCASPRQNIYPQFWLPAKHVLCFSFHMFPRRQKRLSERCTFQF